MNSFHHKARLFAFLVITVAACAALSAQEQVAGDFIITKYPGHVAVNRYIGTNDVIEVPAQIYGLPVDQIFPSAFNDRPKVVKIRIPSSLTSIWIPFVQGCSRLKEFEVDPNNPVYTSVEGVLYSKDENTIIAYPQARTNVYIFPDSVRKVGPWAFDGASVSDVVVNIGTVEIGDAAFQYCTNLQSVYLSETVGFLGGAAFYGCTRLGYLNLPESIRTLSPSGNFSFCSSLVDVVLPESITDIPTGAFLGCTKLRSIKFGSRVYSIGDYAFADCPNLRSIDLPPGIVSIGSFDGCSGLTRIFLPASVKVIGGAGFLGCANLTGIDVDPANASFSSRDGVLFDKGFLTLLQCPAVKEGDYTIPETVRTIGANPLLQAPVFPGSVKIGVLTIPPSVSQLSLCAFVGSGIGHFEVSPSSPSFASDNGVLFTKDKKELWQYPAARKGSYELPSTVTNIRKEAFYGAKSLTQIYIPWHVTIIGAMPFAYCEQLTNITADLGSDYFSSQNGVLFDKSATRLVQFPAGRSGVYRIPASVRIVGAGAFAGAHNLASIILHDRIETIEDYAFSECTGLTSLTFPESRFSYGNGTFDGCDNIRAVYALGNAGTTPNIPSAKVYYLEGKQGWDDPYWGGILWRPGDDLDNDGMTNQDEKDAGTDPLDPNSRISVHATLPIAELSDSEKIPPPVNIQELFIRTISGRTYVVDRAESLAGNWTPVVTVAATANHHRILLEKPSYIGFFRVRALIE